MFKEYVNSTTKLLKEKKLTEKRTPTQLCSSTVFSELYVRKYAAKIETSD